MDLRDNCIQAGCPGRRSARGFTLIELLVVIAIIAILAAILFPIFGTVRERARQTTCLSNGKQLALGVAQYTQDYDERYPIFQYGILPGETAAMAAALGPGQAFSQPPAGCVRANATTGLPFSPPGVCNLTGTNAWMPQFHTEPASRMYVSYRGTSGDNRKWRTWQDFIFPYVKNLGVYDCPSRRSTVGWTDRHVYQANSFLTGLKTQSSISSAKVKDPATKIWSVASNFSMYAIADGDLIGFYMSDCASGGKAKATQRAALTAAGFGCFDYETQYPTSWRTRVYPHNDGNIVTFADGHAKWYVRTWKGLTQNGAADSVTGTPTLRGDQRYWDPDLAGG